MSTLRAIRRTELGISQEELARRSGLHRATIAQAEHLGCIHYSSALRILKAMNELFAEYEWEPISIEQVAWRMSQQSDLAGLFEESHVTPRQVARRAQLCLATVYAAGRHPIRATTHDRLLDAINSLRIAQGLPTIQALPVQLKANHHDSTGGDFGGGGGAFGGGIGGINHHDDLIANNTGDA